MSAPLSAGTSTSGQHATTPVPDVDDGGGSHDGSTPPGADVPSGAQSPTPVDTSQDAPSPNQGTGNDESSGVGQDPASRPVSPQPVISRTGVLDFETVVRHVRAA
ncbi:hypothetical protein PR002_g26247 [Phytophthora rubi]|uniref:Uncharacterized protein n=1 Tax=Phytophthora rubi TaxID=129364 RepID=A0A6A3HRV6_9STRA|nr:hypothetical protein PR002_g26247 [Phytophthora rubi]